MAGTGGTTIIDIRQGPTDFDILKDIKKGLRPEHGGEKSLPTLLLYDEAGLRLFEKITYLDEYYLTNAEIEALETYADQIAQHIQPGSVVVELGSGNLRKVNILLQAIDRLGKDVEYYAVDLSLPELKRTFAEIPTEGYKHVKCFGLYGTYDNALAWLETSHVSAKPKTILWLGSSLGNFKRHEVPPFLAAFRKALQPGNTMLIGIDSCKNPERVYHAYNDKEGVTHAFTLNGLKHANHVFGKEVFKLNEWEAIGEYDTAAGRHHAFVSPVKDVEIDGVKIVKGERIRIEESYKWDRGEIHRLWDQAELVENTVFSYSKGDYGLYLVSKPKVFFPSSPEQYAAEPLPSIDEWSQLWAAWDTVTREMLPKENLLSKPIKLRNACIFYLGHIPTFLDIHISQATGLAATEPIYFRKIFERGIDPDVEDPRKCHAHSEIPKTWPPLEDILEFQDRVREKTRALYASKSVAGPRLSRALWLGFEHEAMHLETLLYMSIRSESLAPPPATVAPDFAALARQAAVLAVDNEWFTIPESSIDIGIDDEDNDSGPARYFGWDSEKPRRTAHVKSFCAKARPITNGEYAEYLFKTGQTAIPASWSDSDSANSNEMNGVGKRDSVLDSHPNGANGITTNGTKGRYVRTVYGNVSLLYALNWPVAASYDELSGCAQWMGGRIPTMEEARSIYSYVNRSAGKDVESPGNTIPAVNGHLVNNGVDESPPSRSVLNAISNAASNLNPRALFIDLVEANVGFQHWHPVSVAEKGNKLCGQSDLGGVWEWTSTALERHPGFEKMRSYPGYTADFFDGKHNLTLGGSWATHPRLAGRQTFINWYQRSYPYAWAGARIVRNT
ncbi:C-type lectin protein [Massariosphaeria phaeospora]|uniref:C-type lectin protein n=1 Tax=Massariosphaeria phaeospora TaxID=100035 RepID=A0A7C8M852_9PLEO|nr:C-type lectin protein [Massariosphaeria phaeospora]